MLIKCISCRNWILSTRCTFVLCVPINITPVNLKKKRWKKPQRYKNAIWKKFSDSNKTQSKSEMINIHIKHYFVAARKLLLLKTMTFDDESQDTEQQGTAENMTATEISATVHGVFKNMGFSKRAITFQMIPKKHGIIQTLVSKTGVPKGMFKP